MKPGSVVLYLWEEGLQLLDKEIEEKNISNILPMLNDAGKAIEIDKSEEVKYQVNTRLGLSIRIENMSNSLGGQIEFTIIDGDHPG
nr:hypothetical protein [uncultured Desulfobacter sp.]